MKYFISVSITLCLFGCNKEQIHPVKAEPTVHLAGALINSDGTTEASYWKDGVYVDLSNNTIRSRVTSMYLDGASVFIGGGKSSDSPSGAAVIWHNGKDSIINGSNYGTYVAARNNNLFGVWFDPSTWWVFYKNGISKRIIDTAHFTPSGLALIGEDMYISGHATESQNLSTPHAQYWKNGELIFRESEKSYAVSISTHHNDVYMAGRLSDNGGPISIACYWKNGKPFILSNKNVYAAAKSVFVTDDHIYVSGNIGQQAVYWKDDEIVMLSTVYVSAIANSIFVHEGDVYVAGSEQGYPAYWKNGVKQNIENQNKIGQIEFVAVGPN